MSHWSADDPRWEDEAATVPYGPPAPVAIPRPPSRRRWTLPARAVGVAALLVAGAGGAVLVTTDRPASSSCRPTSDPSADPVGSCAPEHRYDPRHATLLVGGVRYRLGEPGDVLLVGDWDCDGAPTPALYRPGDGRLFRFSSWPDGGSLESAPAETARAGGRPVVEHLDGCDRIVVHQPG